MKFETLETFDTEICADSVEWCPAENFEDIFVCGTYELKAQENRVGRIYLFQVTKNEKAPLKVVQQLDGPGILDMKWAHVRCSGKVLLGVARFTGLLQIYELTQDSGEVKLSLVTESPIEKAALSLDWSTGRGELNTEVKITVSDSSGSVSVFRLGPAGLEKLASWHAHEFEAWITGFDYWNPNVIYTGGDDATFLSFDTRTDAVAPTVKNRSHEAGVTSLHSNWKKEFYLASGSYDENLRTWDTRSLRRPVEQICLGGGVWRLKWEPCRARYLLAAGMHAGFFIVDAEDASAPRIVAEYAEHESIAYGCDWSHSAKNPGAKFHDGPALLATCSFYDHSLKLSKVDLQDPSILSTCKRDSDDPHDNL